MIALQAMLLRALNYVKRMNLDRAKIVPGSLNFQLKGLVLNSRIG